MAATTGVRDRLLPGFSVRLVVAAVLTGLCAGGGGIFLSLLLHLMQHWAFGYTEENFLAGVQRAAPSRRVVAMAIGGLVVGLGWWALRHWGRPMTSVTQAVADGSRDLPMGIVTADACLQIVAVGAGASLGREGAPRQLGAAFAHLLAKRLGLTPAQRRTIVACGAGAGLAAVYNVPLGGALFTTEILLVSAAVSDVVAALLSSGIATLVAWSVLHDRLTYLVSEPALHSPLLVWAVLVGPLAGFVGVWFVRLTSWSRGLAPTGWRLPLATTTVFTAVGAAAIAFPQLLGNGKGPAQLAFDGTLSLSTLALLVILKPVATAACLASGATGGLLTPALATGAMLGGLTGGAWSMLWPGASVTGYAMIAAAAVLATTQRAPLSAIVLVLEFTGTGLELAVPMILAVAGAMLTGTFLRTSAREHRAATPITPPAAVDQ